MSTPEHPFYKYQQPARDFIPTPWKFTIKSTSAGRDYPPFDLTMENFPASQIKLEEAAEALFEVEKIDVAPSDLCRSIFGSWETFFAFCTQCAGDPTRN